MFYPLGKKDFLDVLDVHTAVDLDVLDVHTVDLAELCERFGTNVETGLTSQQAFSTYIQYGLNSRPNLRAGQVPHQTPELVKFLKTLFTGFSLLLWVAAILSFLAYGLEAGSVLVFVVIVTGIFSYYQESKSSSVMESFKNLVPHTSLVRRNGEKMTVMAKEVCSC